MWILVSTELASAAGSSLLSRGVRALQSQQFSDLGPCWLQVHLDLETGV